MRNLALRGRAALGRQRLLLAAIAAAIITLLLPGSAEAAHGGCAGASSAPSQLSRFAARSALFCLINQERAANGLGTLSGNPALGRAAEHHSRAMNSRNFFGHEPDGSPASRARKRGYMRGASWWMIGETLAWGRGSGGSPGAALSAMMASPTHRAVILDDRFRDIGVGVAMGKPIPERGRNAAIYSVEFGVRK
jgi:uncharacterized protein YkwD